MTLFIHSCVTQLKLYTLDKLSSTIFCCLSVCETSVTPNQFSNLFNIFRHISPTLSQCSESSTAQYTIRGLVFKWNWNPILFLPQYGKTNKEHHLGIKREIPFYGADKGNWGLWWSFSECILCECIVSPAIHKAWALLIEQMHSYEVHSLCIQIVRIQCKN